MNLNEVWRIGCRNVLGFIFMNIAHVEPRRKVFAGYLILCVRHASLLSDTKSVNSDGNIGAYSIRSYRSRMADGRHENGPS